MMQRIIKKITGPGTIFLLTLIAGTLLAFGSGKIIGARLLKYALFSKGQYLFFINGATGDILSLYRAINDGDALTRLAGYYALIDYGLVNADFLIERIRAENAFLVKRTLVWMLGNYCEKKEAMRLLEKIYGESGSDLKNEIQAVIRELKDNDKIGPH